MTLADLFPSEDYSFHLRFERGNLAQFFGPGPQHEFLLAQRRHWLETDPETYAALLPEGVPLLEEAIELVGPDRNRLGTSPHSPNGGLAACIALGLNLEPDFLLLQVEPSTVRLLGGCVCFPSHWDLQEKVGRPIGEIHGVVPGLNQAIGAPIERFLGKLRPGVTWLRANWGLTRSPELNQHPGRKLPRLDDKIGPDEVWVRVEHQALAPLPRTRGVLFGIRLALHPLSEIFADQRLALGLAQALKTMPESMAEYKGLAAARARLISWLQPQNSVS